jgi:phosphopantothenoylcysteine decarboxylase/phosphopantothenate--cysteine ligase
VKNPDILAELGAARRGAHPVLVGFAMETRDIASYGRKKLVDKRVDLIVANEAEVAFGGDDNQAILVSHAGDEALPRMSKRELANRILSRALELARARESAPVKESRRARPRRAPAPARPRRGRSPSKG